MIMLVGGKSAIRRERYDERKMSHSKRVKQVRAQRKANLYQVGVELYSTGFDWAYTYVNNNNYTVSNNHANKNIFLETSSTGLRDHNTKSQSK